MMHLWQRVFDFMLRFGQSFPTAPFSPQVPSDDVVRQRCQWQLEETLELIEASIDMGDADHYGELAGETLERAATMLRGVIRLRRVKVDLVAYADANADIRYVAYGNDVAAGIDSRETDAEVARSNATKTEPEVPGGKVRKGPRYEPPKIEAILREQGWKGPSDPENE